jgi:hypothetical protein
MNSADIMTRYGTQPAMAGVVLPGGPLLAGADEPQASNVVSLDAARTARAAAQWQTAIDQLQARIDQANRERW